MDEARVSVERPQRFINKNCGAWKTFFGETEKWILIKDEYVSVCDKEDMKGKSLNSYPLRLVSFQKLKCGDCFTMHVIETSTKLEFTSPNKTFCETWLRDAITYKLHQTGNNRLIMLKKYEKDVSVTMQEALSSDPMEETAVPQPCRQSDQMPLDDGQHSDNDDEVSATDEVEIDNHEKELIDAINTVESLRVKYQQEITKQSTANSQIQADKSVKLFVQEWMSLMKNILDEYEATNITAVQCCSCISSLFDACMQIVENKMQAILNVLSFEPETDIQDFPSNIRQALLSLISITSECWQDDAIKQLLRKTKDSRNPLYKLDTVLPACIKPLIQFFIQAKISVFGLKLLDASESPDMLIPRMYFNASHVAPCLTTNPDEIRQFRTSPLSELHDHDELSLILTISSDQLKNYTLSELKTMTLRLQLGIDSLRIRCNKRTGTILNTSFPLPDSIAQTWSGAVCSDSLLMELLVNRELQPKQVMPWLRQLYEASESTINFKIKTILSDVLNYELQRETDIMNALPGSVLRPLRRCLQHTYEHWVEFIHADAVEDVHHVVNCPDERLNDEGVQDLILHTFIACCLSDPPIRLDEKVTETPKPIQNLSRKDRSLYLDESPTSQSKQETILAIPGLFRFGTSLTPNRYLYFST